MLYAGLDLSRKRLDVHILDEDGRTVEVTAVSPDAPGLRRLAAHVLRFGDGVDGAIESMTGHASSMTRSSDTAGMSRSPTQPRSRASLHWPPRPIGSTPGFWPSSRGLRSYRRSGSLTHRSGPSASGPASDFILSTTGPR